jgi:glucose/arabinose dehydrogenase/Cu/Zn superoxide dismutase
MRSSLFLIPVFALVLMGGCVAGLSPDTGSLTTLPLEQAATTTPSPEEEPADPQEVMTDTAPLTTTNELTATAFPTRATAELQDANGNIVGTASLTETEGIVSLRVEVSGFTAAEPGEHGIHFHQVGRCSPDFAAAGDHFNPTHAKHGFDNPQGFHMGDLPNLVIDEEGNGILELNDDTVTLSAGERSLLAADGTALVIHSNPDDYVSDPSGRSGSRIACGVIVGEGQSAPEEPTPPEAVTGNNIQPTLLAATPERIASLQVSEGFSITVFASGLGNVRMMAEADDGTLYVTRRAQGDVLALRDDDGDGSADDPIVATSGLTSVHGILISGTQIYLAVPTTIYVGNLVGDGTIEGLTPYATGLPDGGQHGNRTIAFGPDGLLYVSVGSSCNACTETNPEHATILQVQPDGSHTIFAAGLRNTIGWGWHPTTGEFWGMDHGSDWRGDEQPPEELNLIETGNNYGWPYCYADQQIDQYTSTNPPGQTKAEFCALSTGPVLTYTAHSAPIGMVFYTGEQFGEDYLNDAFVAMRGSWNRQEPTGYKVVRIDFDENGQPLGFEDFLTGFLIEEDVAQFGRPAGLLVRQDGSLLLAEDTNGMIYQVTASESAAE